MLSKEKRKIDAKQVEKSVEKKKLLKNRVQRLTLKLQNNVIEVAYMHNKIIPKN